MSELPQQITIDQYVADGVETTYIYAFLIPRDIDIAVYITPPATDPNPTDDIQTLNVDYTVTGEGNTSGGTVVFTVAPPNGSTVTLARNVQFTINTNFSNAQTISGVNLDNAFQQVVLMAQQLNSFYQLRGLQYIINSYIPSSIEPTLMPNLEPGQIWQGAQSGNVIAVTLEENPDVSTLRSELASQVQNADGAELIGYYDEYNNVGETLASFLNGLPTYIANVVSGLVPTIGFQTGDIKPSMNISPLSGWILWANGSIGSAASGASIRANADTQSLFELLWNACDDTICPVSGGRGANATADFVANKALSIPIVDGRTLVNLNGTYTLGQTFGSDSVILTMGQMPAHDHTGSIATLNPTRADSTQSTNRVGSGISGGAGTQVVSLNIAQQGNNDPHENRQPSTAVYYHVKL